MQQSKVFLSLVFALVCLIPSLTFGQTLNFSAHSFQPGPAGAGFSHADLNNDGKEDLVYAEDASVTGRVGYFDVQLSNGDGTYAQPVAYQFPAAASGGWSINGLLLGDFNADGKEDVLVVGEDGNLYLYLNNGSGALSNTAVFPYPIQQYQPFYGVVADFNHDNKADLAFVVGNGVLYVWFGDGKGGFIPGPTTTVSNQGGLLLGDFDGDGNADLALEYAAPYPSLATGALVLYGDGTGHFAQTVNLTLSSPRAVLSAADVNSDGRTDLVTSQLGSTGIFVYYGDTTRAFANQTTLSQAHCVYGSISAADMDGNGINDLVFEAYDCSVLSDPEGNPYAGPQYIDVLTRKSDGTYNPEQTVDNITYLNIYGPAVINADGNGKPDIVAMQCSDDRCSTLDTIITLLNTTEGNFSTCTAPGGAAGIHVCSPVTPPGNGAPAICKPSGDGCSFETAAAGPGIMRSTQLWVDGKQRVEQLSGFSNYTFVNQNLQLTPGIHYVRIVADGRDGSLQEKSFRLVMAGR